MINKLAFFCFVKLRIFKYKWLSDCKNISGKPVVFHPTLLKGKGKIIFGENVQLGVFSSPKFYSHYNYFEARHHDSIITIGNNVAISNAFSIEAFSNISIGDNVLIGVNCAIIDNDGHSLEINNRSSLQANTAGVIIKNNVFLGDNVTILKGVTIGENSVIGNGAVVTKNIPDNAIAAGNPAKTIRNLI